MSHRPPLPPDSGADRIAEGDCSPPPEAEETDSLAPDGSAEPTAEWQHLAASTNHDNASPQPLKKVSRFVIGKRLGKGSFGVVFRAHDPQLVRDVAIKVCRRSSLGDERAIQRFLREARAAGQLRHPYIVPIHEAGRDGDTYFIASGLIEGETLQRRLRAAPPLSARDAAVLLARLAEAVDYAHRQGVVHRDIKPANILINRDGEPQLADFGLARLDQADELHTQDGSRLGTPAYMSPEQARGDSHTVDGRSDIWALGVVLYEILVGGRPFVGDVSKIIHDILTVDPVRPRQVNAAIPRDLETICLKCLAKDPHERFANAAEFAEDLRRWLGGEPILSRSHSLAERAWRWAKRHPFPTAFIVTLVAGAVTSGALAIQWRAQVGVATTQTNIATQATNKANQALKDTQLAQQALALRLAENLLNEGSAACEQHRIDRGMLLFAEALREMPGEVADAKLKQRVDAIRFSLHANLRAWKRQLHVLELWLPSGGFFTPDGARIVTIGGGVRIWDADTGNPIGDQLVADTVEAIACDDAGKCFVSIGATNNKKERSRIHRWNLADLQPVGAAIECGTDLAWATISHDTLRAVTFHRKPLAPTGDLRKQNPLNPGELKFWDLDQSDSPTYVLPILAEEDFWPNMAAFNADASLLFGVIHRKKNDPSGKGSYSARLVAWDFLTGEVSASQETNAFSEYSNRMFADGDGVAMPDGKRSWRLTEGRLVEQPARQAAPVVQVQGGTPPDMYDFSTRRIWNSATGFRGQPLPPIGTSSYSGPQVDRFHAFNRQQTRVLSGGKMWRLCRGAAAAEVADVYPFPDFEDNDRLQLWIEVSTCFARNQASEFDTLLIADWQARRERLLHAD